MVPQRRVDYGFNGYQIPLVPRASRSARGKGPFRKKFEGNQIQAFEILASIAGKLLESKNPLPTNAPCGKGPQCTSQETSKSKQQNEGNLLKDEPCECGSFEGSLRGFEVQEHQQSYTLNQFSHPEENYSSEVNVTSKSNDHPRMVCCAKKLGTVDSSSSCGSYSNKAVSDRTLSGNFIEEKAQPIRKRKLEAEPSKETSIKDGTSHVVGNSEDLIKLERKTPDNSELDVNAPCSGDCNGHGHFLCRYDNVKVISRDDDENPVAFVQPCTVIKEFEHTPDFDDKKLNNVSASKHWRITPDMKVGGYSRTDGKIKQVYHNGRACYAHQRSQKIYPFKKRKFFNRRPFTTSDRGCNCESPFSSPDKKEDCGNCNAGSGPSSLTTGRQPLKSSDRNVKLSIKSFKVPELFIEVPATATVGSLKMSVMEAVTSLLGDGLHVGILVQGKKVRDDTKTLLQTGISWDDKLHNLGFTLEPKHAKLTYSECSDDPPFVSGRPQDVSKHSAPLVSRPGTSIVSTNPPVMNLGGCAEKDFKLAPSLSSTSVDKTSSSSQALVAVPPISAKPLAVVPFHRKSGHPAYVQRRMRRPFSVSEVEALVQAVEKLGTGRWRDVKMRAFDNAKHRTYVDLKDKWKTLVHTARIAPQKRRGEPVPQELLDRVLAAHAYWSQRQAKQQLKAAI